MVHDLSVMGLNPDTIYWMDVSAASYYIIEKTEIKEAHKKKYLKSICFKL
jgi:hypothetical protein